MPFSEDPVASMVENPYPEWMVVRGVCQCVGNSTCATTSYLGSYIIVIDSNHGDGGEGNKD